jgi:hypothetical protein
MSYSRAQLNSTRRSDRSGVSHNAHFTGVTEYDNKGRLPSTIPFIVYTTNAEIGSSRSDLDQLFNSGLPTLTEITLV